MLSFRLNHLLGGTPPPYGSSAPTDTSGTNSDVGGEGADPGRQTSMAWHYHAVNAALHGVVSGLCVQLFAVLRPGAPVAAAAAGLLFAVHPVHVEAVTGVVGRADELGALFCLLAFIAYHNLLCCCGGCGGDDDSRTANVALLRSSVSGSVGWAAAFAACFTLAVLSKVLRRCGGGGGGGGSTRSSADSPAASAP